MIYVSNRNFALIKKSFKYWLKMTIFGQKCPRKPALLLKNVKNIWKLTVIRFLKTSKRAPSLIFHFLRGYLLISMSASWRWRQKNQLHYNLISKWLRNFRPEKQYFRDEDTKRIRHYHYLLCEQKVKTFKLDLIDSSSWSFLRSNNW